MPDTVLRDLIDCCSAGCPLAATGRLVLVSASSPITRRVYNLGLDKFFALYGRERRPGFTKSTVAAWRVALEARGLGAVSINVGITAVGNLAVEAADNRPLRPELANGITREGGRVKVRRLGQPSVKQAQTLLNTPDSTTTEGRCDRARSWQCSSAAG